MKNIKKLSYPPRIPRYQRIVWFLSQNKGEWIDSYKISESLGISAREIATLVSRNGGVEKRMKGGRYSEYRITAEE